MVGSGRPSATLHGIPFVQREAVSQLGPFGAEDFVRRQSQGENASPGKNLHCGECFDSRVPAEYASMCRR